MDRYRWVSRWGLGGSLLVLLVALAGGCGSDDDENGGSSGGDGISIVTTISIIGALAEEVAGEHATVTSLMGPGIDPHTFELTPGAARTASEADVVLVNGLGLDDFLLDDIEGANGDVPLIFVTYDIALIEGGAHEHDEDGHEEEEHEGEGEELEEEGEFDPHVWQDPLRVKVMVANIASALADIDPDNAADYEANAEAYQQTLDETHAEIQRLIDEIPEANRKMVTNHEAFGYFADRYGLEIVGTVIPGTSTEADPSAGELAALAELIEHEGVKAIFTEQLVNPRVAEQLAADTGVEIVHDLYTDSIGEPGSPDATLHGMLLENARKISEALR